MKNIYPLQFLENNNEKYFFTKMSDDLLVRGVISEVDPDGANLEAAPYGGTGAVVFTACLDMQPIAQRLKLGSVGTYYSDATVDPRVFDTLDPDLMLQRTGDLEEFATNQGKIAHYAKVFSSMNALRENPDLPKHLIISKYRLAGVARGGIKYIDEHPNAQFIAIQAGGSKTIINNGTETIMSGDELYWDIPDRIKAPGKNYRKATGFTARKDDPRGKIPAVVVRPYHPGAHGASALQWLLSTQRTMPSSLLQMKNKRKGGHISELFDCLVRIAAVGHSYTGIIPTESGSARVDAAKDRGFREALLNALLGTTAQNNEDSRLFGNLFADTMRCFAAHAQFVAGRKFAKATSNAAPGKPVDVVLGTYRLV